MSQHSPHYLGLWWFCWPRIALWPSVKMLFYSMAPLKPGLSFSWTFNWVQVKKNTQCRAIPPPKKTSHDPTSWHCHCCHCEGNAAKQPDASSSCRVQGSFSAHHWWQRPSTARCNRCGDKSNRFLGFLVYSKILVSPITFIAWFNKLIAKDRSVLQSKDKRYVYLKAQATGRMRPHARRHCADVLVTGSLVNDRFEALRGVERYLEANSLLVTKATSINGIHASSWSTDLMAVSQRQEGIFYKSIFLVGNSWGTTFYAGNTNVDSVARCDVSWHNCFRYFCFVTVWRALTFLGVLTKVILHKEH